MSVGPSCLVKRRHLVKFYSSEKTQEKILSYANISSLITLRTDLGEYEKKTNPFRIRGKSCLWKTSDLVFPKSFSDPMTSVCITS